MTSRIPLSLFALFAICCVNSQALSDDKANRIDALMKGLYQRGQFNGSIIVAARGKVIYRDAFGETNFQSHQKFTPATQSCLGSVSKQFTAMTIMMLAELKKLDY